MNRLPRTLRLAVLTAALLHALVGGWGPWLHGAPAPAAAVVHGQTDDAAPGLAEHGPDCALCHSAAIHKLAASGAPVWADARRSGLRFDTRLPAVRPASPRLSGGARAPPVPV